MPPCKNDSTRNYKGTEPSPKGLGYCAHAEKMGVIKKGKDKNLWIVSKTKNKIKRWVKYKLPDKLTEEQFDKLSKQIAQENKDDDDYSHTKIKQKEDFNLYNYFDIKIKKTAKEYKITMKFLKKKHPEYTTIRTFYLQTSNKKNDVIEVKKYTPGSIGGNYSKKAITEMTKKNNFKFNLGNLGGGFVSIWMVLKADMKKYPELLDLELEKIIKL